MINNYQNDILIKYVCAYRSKSKANKKEDNYNVTT